MTGRLGSGKSRIADEIAHTVERLGLRPVRVDAVADLYRSFMPAPPDGDYRKLSRSEITRAVSAAHAELGETAGTILLREYLVARPSDGFVYILDSKRTASSIRTLRDLLPQVQVVGVWAPDELRRERVVGRQAVRDRNASFASLDAAERRRFDISACLAESDIVIENDLPGLPLRLSVLAYDICRRLVGGTEGYGEGRGEHLQPMAKACPPDGPTCSLTREEMRSGLDRVAAIHDAEPGTLFAIVQGGNEYISDYLRRRDCSVVEVKLSSLNKQGLGVLLSSALTARERSAELSDGESVGATLAAMPTVSSPFAQHAQLGSHGIAEFDTFLSQIEDSSASIEMSHELRQALLRSKVGSAFAGADQVVFVDDILYRGRTVHSAWSFLRGLGVERSRWRFVTLCPDRSNPVLHGRSPRITTLFPDRAYSFENCPISSDGYWDFVGTRFEYRPFHLLREYAEQVMPAGSHNSHLLAAEFRRIATMFAASVPLPRDLFPVMDSLTRLFAFQFAWNPEWEPVADDFADQRSSFLGWCPPFMEFWESFIAQEQSLKSREQFKGHVIDMVKYLGAARSSSWFEDLVDMARQATPEIVRASRYVDRRPI